MCVITGVAWDSSIIIEEYIACCLRLPSFCCYYGASSPSLPIIILFLSSRFTLCDRQIKVLFFAKSREITGVSETTAVVPSAVSAPSLINAIIRIFPRYERTMISMILFSTILMFILSWLSFMVEQCLLQPRGDQAHACAGREPRICRNG